VVVFLILVLILLPGARGFCLSAVLVSLQVHLYQPRLMPLLYESEFNSLIAN
jgi:hypothetical protein